MMNIGALRSGRYDYVENDIRAVVEAAEVDAGLGGAPGAGQSRSWSANSRGGLVGY